MGYTYLFLKYLLTNFLISIIFIIILNYKDNLTPFFMCYFIILNILSIFFFIFRSNFFFVRFKKNKYIYKLNQLNFECDLNFPLYYKKSDELLYYLDSLDSLLATIPLHIKERFIRYSYVMIVAKRDDVKDLINKSGYLRATGQFLYLDKVLFVLIDDLNKNLLDITSFSYVFYHEWGHFIDYTSDIPSQKSLWRNEYKKQLKNIKEQRKMLYKEKFKIFLFINSKNKISKILYNLKNETEYFADMYAKYKMSKLQRSIPKELLIDLENIECKKSKYL